MVEMLDAAAEDAIEHGNWFDSLSVLATSFGLQDASKILSLCPSVQSSLKSNKGKHSFLGSVMFSSMALSSHGMDIMGPVRQYESDNHPNCIRSTDLQGKEVNLFQPASEFLPMIDESWTTIAECIHDILKDYPRLRLTHGRKVLEVRPVIDWDKGKAVEFLLESLGLSSCDDMLPIYVGDDRTDEDAFKVLREGNQGFGILVSSVPKETNAFYSLRDPSELSSNEASFRRERLYVNKLNISLVQV